MTVGNEKRKYKKDGCLKFLIWDGGEKGQNIPRKMTEEEECSSSPFPPRGGARGEGDVAENIQSHLPQLLPPTFALPPPPFQSKAAIRFHFLLESHHRARGRKGGEINLVAASSARNLQRRETGGATTTDCRSLFEFRTQRILLLSLRLCL